MNLDNIDRSKLSICEKKTLAIFNDKETLNSIREFNPKTYEREVAKFRKIISKFPSDIVAETANLIEYKIVELLDL